MKQPVDIPNLYTRSSECTRVHAKRDASAAESIDHGGWRMVAFGAPVGRGMEMRGWRIGNGRVSRDTAQELEHRRVGWEKAFWNVVATPGHGEIPEHVLVQATHALPPLPGPQLHLDPVRPRITKFSYLLFASTATIPRFWPGWRTWIAVGWWRVGEKVSSGCVYIYPLCTRVWGFWSLGMGHWGIDCCRWFNCFNRWEMYGGVEFWLGGMGSTATYASDVVII